MSKTLPEIPERIDVFPLPDLVPAGYRPAAAVFIDVLRATTSITAALAAGAEKVIPVMEPVQAFNMKRLFEGTDPQQKGKILLGGERKGVRIEGFDLGNSPSSYTAEKVRGKTLLFSTTNGTRAILTFERLSAAAPAETPPEKGTRRGPSIRRHSVRLPDEARSRAFLGSFLNAGALTEKLRRFRSVGIVCSGTELRYTEEDVLLAGLLVSRLVRPSGTGESHRPRPLLNAQAETAAYLWESFLETTAPGTLEKSLYERLLSSRGGENLKRINLQSDVRDAACLDRLNVVPEYTLGTIRLAGNGAD